MKEWIIPEDGIFASAEFELRVRLEQPCGRGSDDGSAQLGGRLSA
jgi:hypothetical protein